MDGPNNNTACGAPGPSRSAHSKLSDRGGNEFEEAHYSHGAGTPARALCTTAQTNALEPEPINNATRSSDDNGMSIGLLRQKQQKCGFFTNSAVPYLPLFTQAKCTNAVVSFFTATN